MWPWKRNKGHWNLITSFLNPNNVSVLILSNSIYWFMRQSAHKAHFLSIYNVVTLKIRSRSPKPNQFFPPSLGCICASLVKFQPLVKEIICTQTFYCIKKSHFLSIYYVVTLKTRLGSPESYHFFPPSVWCICASLVKFQPLVKEIVCTQTFYCMNKAHFLSICNIVTLKIRSRSSKSNHFFPPSWWCMCASLVKSQPLVKEIVRSQTFYCINKAHFLSIYNVVTLKIRSRSQKSNHFFSLSWWCIFASLVKFQPLVKEIVCTQTFTALRNFTKGNNSKRMGP